MIFSDDDLRSVRAHGLDEDEVERQIELFRTPPPPVELVRAATVGDGIDRLPESIWPALQALFHDSAAAGRWAKFVPASGAATRMFKALLAVHQASTADQDVTAELHHLQAARRFLAEVDRFPFRDDLARILAQRGLDLRAVVETEDVVRAMAALFDPEDADPPGLGFGTEPKALIPFHRIPASGDGEVDGGDDIARTPLAEHVFEAADHMVSNDGTCIVHFTIPQHRELDFRAAFRALAAAYEAKTGGRLELSCSIQRPSTDTIAVEIDEFSNDPSDEPRPVRDADGHLVFRPGGHGALLPNLGQLTEDTGADLMLVRNIDNILPEAARREVLLWNRLLGGHLVTLEEQIVHHLDLVRRAQTRTGVTAGSGDDTATRQVLEDALRFVASALHVAEADEIRERSPEVQQAWLIDRLDRPLRVCGMVRNDGEPGGGPFWVRDAEGRDSLQIVESAQIDQDDPRQAEIAAGATHFSPAHIVCRLRSDSGTPYDLDAFVDQSTVFLTRKVYEGRAIRVLERPGLWNGSMARWNTVFVEMPAEVFAPVKTVFDLLRPEHQA